MSTPTLKAAIADPDTVSRRGIRAILEDMGYCVTIEARNGAELLQALQDAQAKPDICIMEVLMPQMSGAFTMKCIKECWPHIKGVVMTRLDDPYNLLNMVQHNANGYVLKSDSIEHMQAELSEIKLTGFYCSPRLLSDVNAQLIKAMQYRKNGWLTERDVRFLSYCSTDMSYHEIADKMHMGRRTVENYCRKLFKKLDVKSRQGLAIYSVRAGITTG